MKYFLLLIIVSLSLVKLTAQSISVNPSPFNFTATVNYTLATNDTASIHIFNRWGQCVDTVLEWSYQLAGIYQKTIDLTGQPEDNYVVLFKYATKKQNFNVVNTTQPLGINQNEKLAEMCIYPNPVNDYLNISSIQVPRNTTFTLVDNLGKVVFYSSDLKPPYQIKMEMLPKGTYFLKIKTQKSEDSFKIVKE